MGNKLFIFIRTLIFPFGKLNEYIPFKGEVLDVGCGHGTLAYQLTKVKKRNILAIDPDKRKIRAAKKLYQANNLVFESKKLESVRRKFDIIIIVDVLYLLPEQTKLSMLSKAIKLLKNNGKIIIVETPTDSLVAKVLLFVEETLMTKILRLTHTSQPRVYLLPQKDYKKIFKKAKLKIVRTKHLRGILPYDHVLFEVKPEPRTH